MTGYSLHIGLNEVSSNYGGNIATLKSCHNDAKAMLNIASQQGFKPLILLDEKANYEAVVTNIERLAYYTKPGDICLITYSGHGSQIRDKNGDEVDGLDETWVLYDKMLIDDELHQLWSLFPSGSRLVIISDSCHSGTIVKSTEKPISEKEIIPECKASGILISGCRDSQFSFDGDANGNSTFTKALLEVWDSGRFKGSYKQMRNLIAQKLPKNQNPNYLIFGRKNPKFSRQKPFEVRL